MDSSYKGTSGVVVVLPEEVPVLVEVFVEVLVAVFVEVLVEALVEELSVLSEVPFEPESVFPSVFGSKDPVSDAEIIPEFVLLPVSVEGSLPAQATKDRVRVRIKIKAKILFFMVSPDY
jgi:hypothetical protein